MVEVAAIDEDAIDEVETLVVDALLVVDGLAAGAPSTKDERARAATIGASMAKDVREDLRTLGSRGCL